MAWFWRRSPVLPFESYILAQLMHMDFTGVVYKNFKAQRVSLTGGWKKKSMIIIGYAKIRNPIV